MAQSSDDRDERRLPASERKLQQARESGQVPRSREAGHAAALLAALACVALYGPSFAERALSLVRGTLRFDRALTREPEQALAAARAAGAEALWAMLPLLVVPLLASLAATVAIGGLVLTTKPLEPDLSRLDPVAGIGRLFSVRSAIDLGKLAGIALAVGSVGAWIAVDGLDRFVAYSGMPLPAALASAGGDFRAGVLAIAAVVVVAALVDAPLQIWRFRREMMMTPAEAQQEHRESEGDPLVKGKIKERQRAMSRGRMLAAVPGADVVVTNPTHFAVALKYEDGAMGAPKVVAKGADLLAARIREIAAESGVPLLESPPLARALYAHVEVDREIPAALYAAVAQVLAWVYQLDQHARGRAARPAEPGIVLPPGLDPQEAAS
ncbi:MAG TPA: flagellar type III secretion system protein FlhB [Burkholderiaceae bacterium]|nr:flagellar type III secretion system protein FlhB [Burkholderiaceae bacterium]